MHFQYCVPLGMLEGNVMVMVTVEPSVMLVILNEKKPCGKSWPGLVQVSCDCAQAVKPVMLPALVVKVAIPVPVAVLVVAVGIGCAILAAKAS